MKTIVSVLLLLAVVSCSRTPPADFQPYGTPARAEAGPPSAAATTNQEAYGLIVAATNPAAAVLPSATAKSTNAAPAVVLATNAPPAANVATNVPPAPSEGAKSSEEVIPAGMINFPATDLNQVLQIYAELVNRTVLRPANLPAPLITLKTQTPLSKKEAIQAFDAVLAMNGITMINIGEKFVKAVPTAQANQEGAPINRADGASLPEIGHYVTHVVQLKYVKPTVIQPVLQQFAKIQGSILPIDDSQVLVLRDYTENVKRMLEMIKEIDVSVPSEFISEVIPIRYAKASDIQDALNSLAGGGGGTSVGRGSTGSGRTGAVQGGMSRPGMTGAGAAPYGMQQGTPGAAPGQPGAAAGPSFAERLRQVVKTATASGQLQILGETKIIADERSNSLLIFAARADMEMIKSIVAKLDVVLAQVIIDSIIMDVQIGSALEVGFSGWQTKKEYNPDVTGAGGYNNGQPLFDLVNFVNNGGQSNNFFPGSLGGGFTYWAQLGNNFNAVLRAADADSRVNVIQKPRILTSHATAGSIFVGNTVPYITQANYGGGYYGASSMYQQLQVGIGLTVTPYINQDGLVVMQIDENIDEISGSTTIAGVGDVPNTTSRRLSAEVAVRDGDAILLGGFIRNSSNKKESGIPLLKDIPILGPLFGSRSNAKQRNELVVLMRPTVLKTPDIAARVTSEEKNKLPGISAAEAEVRKSEKKELELQRRRMASDEAAEAADETKSLRMDR
jgi:general secretion pathway protein D